MEDLDKKIKKVMNSKIQEPVNYEQKILNTIRRNSNKLGRKERRDGSFIMKKRIIATACASLVLVSGIVVAANIENIKNHFNRGLGEGMQTAIDNGYIAKPEMEFVKVDNVGTKVKIEDLVMDDLNLSTKFIFEFDENVTNTIDMSKVSDIELSDLFVRDEDNRIIYSSPNQEAFERYCKENNLNYIFGEFNENYMNNGLNAFIGSKDGNSIELMYNMYSADNMPKSKKLYFSFETITITEYTLGKQTNYKLNGSWSATVDVPKEMYDRTEEYYEVVSCDNNDFEIYTAKLTNTGFELGVMISNVEPPKVDHRKEKEYERALSDYRKGKITRKEYLEKSNWYIYYCNQKMPVTILNYNCVDEPVEPSYVENEDGKKFTSTLSPTRNAKNYFMPGNKYDFYETFGMTKYNATNKIKVVLYYYGEPVTIELQKTNS